MFSEQVEAVLEGIRPVLARHRGDVELVSANLKTGRVELRLKGACDGCPFSQLTLKMGIEAALRDALPEVTDIIAL
ncbi:NifU family protein [Candidatus Uhrbacteria bacterium]|nr:NifU family protein [Candidatus Uhrbacteria bacterium]